MSQVQHAFASITKVAWSSSIYVRANDFRQIGLGSNPGMTKHYFTRLYRLAESPESLTSSNSHSNLSISAVQTPARQLEDVAIQITLARKQLAQIGLVVAKYQRSEAEACYRVLFDAVHKGTAHHYSPEQQVAWVPSPDMPADWPTWLSGNHSFTATRFGRVLGFISLANDGNLDFLYVRPDWHGTGVADSLYHHIETVAKDLELRVLTTEASLLAQPLLQRHGWEIKARQHVIRNGVTLPNARMEKRLA